MSRGLGLQQWKMLQAIARQRPPQQSLGGWLPVGLAVNEFCRRDNQLPERVDRHLQRQEEKRQREAAEYATWKQQDQDYRTRIAAGAAAGDPEAIEAQKRQRYLDFLAIGIRRRRKSVQAQFSGRHQERHVPQADALLNPSRIINSLVNRGLIERYPHQRGVVRLTEAGAALV